MLSVELTDNDLQCSGCAAFLRGRSPEPCLPGVPWQSIGMSVHPLKVHEKVIGSRKALIVDEGLCFNCSPREVSGGIRQDSWRLDY